MHIFGEPMTHPRVTVQFLCFSQSEHPYSSYQRPLTHTSPLHIPAAKPEKPGGQGVLGRGSCEELSGKQTMEVLWERLRVGPMQGPQSAVHRSRSRSKALTGVSSLVALDSCLTSCMWFP